MFDHKAESDHELTINPGDIITLLDTSGEEWWQGELNGKIGFFPKVAASYII